MPRRRTWPSGSRGGTDTAVPSHPDPHDFDENDVVVTHEKSYAAGVPAVLVSLRRGLEQMGMVRTARTLAKLTQRNGFDCPAVPGRKRPAGFLRGQSMNVYTHGDRVTAAN